MGDSEKLDLPEFLKPRPQPPALTHDLIQQRLKELKHYRLQLASKLQQVEGGIAELSRLIEQSSDSALVPGATHRAGEIVEGSARSSDPT